MASVNLLYSYCEIKYYAINKCIIVFNFEKNRHHHGQSMKGKCERVRERIQSANWDRHLRWEIGKMQVLISD